MTTLLERATQAIEGDERLDPPAYQTQNALTAGFAMTGTASQPIQNALHGVWLRHPLHPALATLPIGTITLAFGLDTADTLGIARSRSMRDAADTALGVGVASAVVAAVAGMADYRKVHGRDRRVGLAHALVNTTALALSLGSLVARRRGDRARGKALGAAGWLALATGGYLGGHLVYRRRVGVDQGDRSAEPRRWTTVAALDALPENRPVRVEVWDEDARQGVGVAVVLHGGRVHAMGSRCSHLGGPLDKGWVFRGGLVCPWHGSRYCLRTGRPVDGPSTAPQPLYDTRVRDGLVEIRRRLAPGDEAPRLEGPADEEGAAAGRSANEVIFEHHQFLRSLFRLVKGMSPDDPERRDVLKVLASELVIHEHVEDVLYYPAVRAVSAEVPAAHAEHQELTDMLVAVLRLPTSSPEFEEHFDALHAGVEHHASSEESHMFHDAERLGPARLAELGSEIEALIEKERHSRARTAFRDLKLRVLGGSHP